MPRPLGTGIASLRAFCQHITEYVRGAYMVSPDVQQVTSRQIARPPRFFAHLAPGWALYSYAVLITSALTGIIGWMAQRGIRLIWGILTALGIGAQIAGLGLLWQRAAWRG